MAPSPSRLTFSGVVPGLVAVGAWVVPGLVPFVAVGFPVLGLPVFGSPALGLPVLGVVGLPLGGGGGWVVVVLFETCLSLRPISFSARVWCLASALIWAAVLGVPGNLGGGCLVPVCFVPLGAVAPDSLPPPPR